jgi:hypothetical protein
MATGDTALSICSDALIALGAAPISSFTEGTDAAQACDRLYPDLRDTILSTYQWSFSIKKTQLARLATAPTNEWKYAYQMPGDMLSGVLAIFASSGSNELPLRYGWEVYGDQVFTNLETVYIDYQATVNETKIPPYFVRLLRLAMAFELAIIITDQTAKADYYRALAYGSPSENGRGGEMRKAMNIDGRGQSTQVIDDYELISVRH